MSFGSYPGAAPVPSVEFGNTLCVQGTGTTDTTSAVSAGTNVFCGKGSPTMTLPLISGLGLTSTFLVVTNTDSGTTTVSAHSGDTINGGASITLAGAYKGAFVFPDPCTARNWIALKTA